MAQIEAVRVAQDAAYAASLSDADWQQLAQDPTWQELVAEQSELVSSVIAVHGHKLPGAARAAPAASRGAAGGGGPRAEGALPLMEVQYRVPPAVLDMIEGMKSSTAKQFQSNEAGTIIATTPPLVRGDPNKTTADVTVDLLAKKSTEQHVALELTNSLAWWDNDKLNMHYTAQHAHGTRSGLAQALKIPQNKVRVVQQGYIGSGYGYRSGIDPSEVHAAILSKLTGRPIKNNYTRYEDFVTRTHRPQFQDEMKMGVNRDGTIQFGQFKVIANVGAQRAGAANGSWINMQDHYKIPNLRLQAGDRKTKNYKSGPQPPLGHPKRHL